MSNNTSEKKVTVIVTLKNQSTYKFQKMRIPIDRICYPKTDHLDGLILCRTLTETGFMIQEWDESKGELSYEMIPASSIYRLRVKIKEGNEDGE